MERAVVAIGVNTTGGLPTLEAAVKSAVEFAGWATDHQKVPADRVRLFTDAAGKVRLADIFDAVNEITALGFIEQLIVYFSGHGINAGQGEQWLLSDAPRDAGAAVNVTGSELSARFCGLSHVVLVSDACRTAAADIQNIRVTGNSIFPNLPPEGEERPVDQFFATLVGKPALETRTGEEGAKQYRAAYSTVLLEALRGDVRSIITEGADRRVIRPRALKRHLSIAVPEFLRNANLAGGITQQSDARITSDDDAWVAEIAAEITGGAAAGPAPAAPPTVGGRMRAFRRRASAGRPKGDRALPPPGVVSVARTRGLVAEARDRLFATLAPEAATMKRRAPGRPVSRSAAEAQRLLDASLAAASIRFGPDRFETECGMKVRGARVVEALAHSRFAEVAVGPDGQTVRVTLARTRRAANVMVRLADRSAIVVPVMQGWIAALTIDADAGLDDVSYEPSANTQRARVVDRQAADARRLRDVLAAAASLGVLRVDQPQDADELEARLRSLALLDPALAVNAAYAFHDRRRRNAIAASAERLSRELGLQIFDVAMLSRALSGKPASATVGPATYPFVPMRTLGWALVGPFGVALHDGLQALRGRLRPSLWTHFEPPAADILSRTITEGAVG